MGGGIRNRLGKNAKLAPDLGGLPAETCPLSCSICDLGASELQEASLKTAARPQGGGRIGATSLEEGVSAELRYRM